MFDLGFSGNDFDFGRRRAGRGAEGNSAVMRGAGRVFRRLQYVRYAFTQQFEDFMSAADLNADVNFEDKRAAKDSEFNEEDEDAAYHAELEPPLDEEDLRDDER